MQFTKSYSQSGQDLFVLEKTNFIKKGSYVDIASGHPTFINNTYLLESEYDWNGISIEMDSSWNNEWKNRKSEFINVDAFILNYDYIFDEFIKKHELKNNHFNYLSLDLEPPELTNKLLHILPLKKYTFDVITYEHDLYRVGDTYKNDAKKYLTSLGYILEKENIKTPGDYNIFEDWYVKSWN